MRVTVSLPSMTSPKIVCFPSSHGYTIIIIFNIIRNYINKYNDTMTVLREKISIIENQHFANQ